MQSPGQCLDSAQSWAAECTVKLKVLHWKVTLSLTFPEGKQRHLDFKTEVFHYFVYLHIQAAKYINMKYLSQNHRIIQLGKQLRRTVVEPPAQRWVSLGSDHFVQGIFY